MITRSSTSRRTASPRRAIHLSAKAGALPEIWSYGHPGEEGLTIHPQTGHGPRGGDELNTPNARKD